MRHKKHLKELDIADQEHVSIQNHYPAFSFRYLQEASINECSKVKFFYTFLMRLRTLSCTEWKEIDKSSRHSFGYEKIPISLIHVALPSVITPEVKTLTVFRATGDNHAFIGFRDLDVFSIIFIESQFGDIYNH